MKASKRCSRSEGNTIRITFGGTRVPESARQATFLMPDHTIQAGNRPRSRNRTWQRFFSASRAQSSPRLCPASVGPPLAAGTVQRQGQLQVIESGGFQANPRPTVFSGPQPSDQRPMSCAVVIKGMFSRPTSSAGGHHQPLSRNINTSKVARIFFHGYPSLVIFVTFGAPDLEFGRPALSHRLTITDTLDIPRPRPGRREARLQTGFCRRTTATGLRDETAFPKVSAMKTQLFTWSHPKTTHARPPDPARLLRRVLLGTLRSLTRIQPVLITLGNIQGTRVPESARQATFLMPDHTIQAGNRPRSRNRTWQRPPEPSRRQGYARQASALHWLPNRFPSAKVRWIWG